MSTNSKNQNPNNNHHGRINAKVVILPIIPQKWKIPKLEEQNNIF